MTPNLATLDFIPPKHPRYDSIRQRENFYLSQLAFGICLPCAYRWLDSEYSSLIAGYREGSTVWYFTYCIAPRIAEPTRPPLFHCFGLDDSDIMQEESVVEHRFNLYTTFVQSKYVWSTTPGRLRGDLNLQESAIGPVQVLSSAPDEWNNFAAGMPQCRINSEFRRAPAREAPPAPALWPPDRKSVV